MEFPNKNKAGDATPVTGEHSLFLAVCPPVGTAIGLRISMEGFADEAAALRIDVKGRVLRVERSEASGGNDGFAVLLSNAIVAGSEAGKFCFYRS